MNWEQALDIVVGRTDARGLRRLCGETNHNERSRDACRRRVIAMANGIVEPGPTQQETWPKAQGPPPPRDDWTARIRACPDYHPGCCSRPAPHCSRYEISPAREQCIACLSGQDPRLVQVTAPDIAGVLGLYGRSGDTDHKD